MPDLAKNEEPQAEVKVACLGPFMKDDPARLFSRRFVMVVSVLNACVFEEGMPMWQEVALCGWLTFWNWLQVCSWKVFVT